MNTFSPDYNENKINNILLSLSKEISSFSNLKNPSINLKKRREFFIKELEDLTFDASRHNISIKTIELSKKLLQEMKTNQFLEAMWSGKVVNITENRQALHPALRGSRDSFFPKDIMNEVTKQKKQMLKIAEGVRNGNIKSHSGKKYTSVLAIGIGGSDLGPRMSVKALTPFKSNIDVRFVSNIDPSDLINATADLDPSRTLIIVSSKTFTTIETLTNAKAAFEWLAKNIGEIGAKSQQYAITSNFDNAKIFKNVIIMNSWIIMTLFSNKSSNIAPKLISLSSRANSFDFLNIKLCSPQNFRNSEDGMLFGLGCASLGSKIVTFDFSSSCSTLTSIIYLPVFNLHRTGCILLAFSKPERLVLIALQRILCVFAKSFI